MKKIFYTLGVSTEHFEGYKRFYKFYRLVDFIQQIPEHELKNCCVTKHKDGIIYVGQFFIKSRGGLSVVF